MISMVFMHGYLDVVCALIVIGTMETNNYLFETYFILHSMATVLTISGLHLLNNTKHQKVSKKAEKVICKNTCTQTPKWEKSVNHRIKVYPKSTELIELRKKYKMLENTADATIKSMRSELKYTKDALTDLVSLNSDLKKQIDQRQNEENYAMNDMIHRLTTAQETIQTLKSEKNKKIEQMSDKYKKLKSRFDKCQKMDECIIKYKQKNKKLKNKLNEMYIEQKRVSLQLIRLRSLTKERNENAQIMADLKLKNEKLRNNIDQMEQDQDGMNVTINQLKKANKAYHCALSAMASNKWAKNGKTTKSLDME